MDKLRYDMRITEQFKIPYPKPASAKVAWNRQYGMSIEQIQHYARPTLCSGDERVCEFKKFGIKEKINERNHLH